MPMPSVEERISSVEAKVDAIADIKVMVGELRADMNRQFSEVRADMNRQFTEVKADMNRRFGEVDNRFGQVDRRLEILDHRMERHFMWMVGIQFTVLIAVIVALIETSAR
jgi:nitrate/nitrite-specific signal transduction histidine kinase